jgi:hypothetical protein
MNYSGQYSHQYNLSFNLVLLREKEKNKRDDEPKLFQVPGES